MKLFEELPDEVKFDDEDCSKESYCPFKFFLGSINITKENVLLLTKKLTLWHVSLNLWLMRFVNNEIV